MKLQKIETEGMIIKCSLLCVDVYNSDPWNDSWTETKAYERLLHYFDSPSFIGIAAFINKNIVGCLLGNVEPFFSGDYFYLKEMFIAKEFQRNGIGSRLISQLKDELLKSQISEIMLFTSSAFFPYQFYKRNGFTVINNMCLMDCTC